MTPESGRLDEATPAGLFLYACTTLEGEPLEAMLASLEADIEAIGTLAAGGALEGHMLVTVLSGFERRAAVCAEFRRREVESRRASK